MIYIRYKNPNDENYTVWEMPLDLSTERCIYSSKNNKYSDDCVEYDEGTVLSDLENRFIVDILTYDEAFLEVV